MDSHRLLAIQLAHFGDFFPRRELDAPEKKARPIGDDDFERVLDEALRRPSKAPGSFRK